jgi:ADP-ribosylation factor GTPase-activating protein 2/3
MEEFSEIFEIMQRDNENKMCVDCYRPYPLFASITNGIFICEQCANEHKKLGTGISYIRGLKEKWDEYLLAYMLRGGNRRFKTTLAQYDIIEDADLQYKYRTKAINNYRLLVSK